MIGDDVVQVRGYQVTSTRTGPTTLLLRGEVYDDKPEWLLMPDEQVPDAPPIRMHHMVVELELGMPQAEITRARVGLRSHPHDACPAIEQAYDGLVGLSIGRGFTRAVQERFGGPQGCTHVNALLIAMAPVAIQSKFAFTGASDLTRNIGTCHAWADGGTLAADAREGEFREVPLPIAARRAERAQHGGA
jgi:hypothetical protein